MYLLHCNWGWDGVYNGYFYEGVFKAYNPVDTTNTPVLQGSTPLYFQYELEQIADVYP